MTDKEPAAAHHDGRTPPAPSGTRLPSSQQGPAAVISFEIPGDVVPWARAGLRGRQHFTPARQMNYMAAVKTFCAIAMRGRKAIEGPVELVITATYQRPKSRFKNCGHWKASKPDADNIAKLVKDSLNRQAWRDDEQVACLAVFKVYGEFPGLRVQIRELLP